MKSRKFHLLIPLLFFLLLRCNDIAFQHLFAWCICAQKIDVKIAMKPVNCLYLSFSYPKKWLLSSALILSLECWAHENKLWTEGSRSVQHLCVCVYVCIFECIELRWIGIVSSRIWFRRSVYELKTETLRAYELTLSRSSLHGYLNRSFTLFDRSPFSCSIAIKNQKANKLFGIIITQSCDERITSALFVSSLSRTRDLFLHSEKDAFFDAWSCHADDVELNVRFSSNDIAADMGWSTNLEWLQKRSGTHKMMKLTNCALASGKMQLKNEINIALKHEERMAIKILCLCVCVPSNDNVKRNQIMKQVENDIKDRTHSHTHTHTQRDARFMCARVEKLKHVNKMK